MVHVRDLLVSCAPPSRLVAESAAAGPWLSAGEQRQLAQLRDRRRREQWLAGRWLSKRLIKRFVAADLAAIEICTRDQRQRGIRPVVTIGGSELAGALSIAHTEPAVLVAFAPGERVSVGVDLVDEVPQGAGFWKHWFSEREQAWIARNPARRGPVAWAIKEAIYKAANRGEPWDPRHIEVLSKRRGRLLVLHHGRPLRRLNIKAQQNGRLIRAVACLPVGAALAS